MSSIATRMHPRMSDPPGEGEKFKGSRRNQPKPGFISPGITPFQKGRGKAIHRGSTQQDGGEEEGPFSGHLVKPLRSSPPGNRGTFHHDRPGAKTGCSTLVTFPGGQRAEPPWEVAPQPGAHAHQKGTQNKPHARPNQEGDGGKTRGPV